jgi:hypothetical protein
MQDPSSTVKDDLTDAETEDRALTSEAVAFCNDQDLIVEQVMTVTGCSRRDAIRELSRYPDNPSATTEAILWRLILEL